MQSEIMNVLKSELIRIQEWRLTKNELAYGSTLLISIAPFLVLFLFKVDNSTKHRNKLRLALSFASGGLLGDAFLHLIPHSMGHGHHDHNHEEQHHHNHHHDGSNEHSHEHEEEHHHHNHHEQTIVGLYIIAGIILFFIIEKFIHIVKGESHHHGHHHHQQQQHFKRKEKKSDSEETSDDELLQQQQPNLKNRKTPKSLKKTKSYSKSRDSDLQQKTKLVSGILNLIADFLHNFTDGLAIGATFAAGKGMGSITAVTILLHEIPHEIGDYAILIQAGYQRRNALLLQLVTAIGALIGTAVGLHYGTLEHATQFILPITAGGFIYIATVTVIPELLEKANNHLQSLLEIISMFAGVAMLYWIALNE